MKSMKLISVAVVIAGGQADPIPKRSEPVGYGASAPYVYGYGNAPSNWVPGATTSFKETSLYSKTSSSLFSESSTEALPVIASSAGSNSEEIVTVRTSHVVTIHEWPSHSASDTSFSVIPSSLVASSGSKSEWFSSPSSSNVVSVSTVSSAFATSVPEGCFNAYGGLYYCNGTLVPGTSTSSTSLSSSLVSPFIMSNFSSAEISSSSASTSTHLPITRTQWWPADYTHLGPSQGGSVSSTLVHPNLDNSSSTFPWNGHSSHIHTHSTAYRSTAPSGTWNASSISFTQAVESSITAGPIITSGSVISQASYAWNSTCEEDHSGTISHPVSPSLSSSTSPSSTEVSPVIASNSHSKNLSSSTTSLFPSSTIESFVLYATTSSSTSDLVPSSTGTSFVFSSSSSVGTGILGSSYFEEASQSSSSTEASPVIVTSSGVASSISSPSSRPWSVTTSSTSCTDEISTASSTEVSPITASLSSTTLAPSGWIWSFTPPVFLTTIPGPSFGSYPTDVPSEVSISSIPPSSTEVSPIFSSSPSARSFLSTPSGAPSSPWSPFSTGGWYRHSHQPYWYRTGISSLAPSSSPASPVIGSQSSVLASETICASSSYIATYNTSAMVPSSTDVSPVIKSSSQGSSSYIGSTNSALFLSSSPVSPVLTSSSPMSSSTSNSETISSSIPSTLMTIVSTISTSRESTQWFYPSGYRFSGWPSATASAHLGSSSWSSDEWTAEGDSDSDLGQAWTDAENHAGEAREKAESLWSKIFAGIW